MGRLQTGDVELAHPEHRLHHPLGLGGVAIAEQLRQHGRHDLPGQAEAVLEPTATLRRTAIGKSVPQSVDRGLVAVTYGGGDKCSTDTYGSCGGAIQFH